MNMLTYLHSSFKEVLAISESLISHSFKWLVLTEAWPPDSDIISPAVLFITVSVSLPLVLQVQIWLEMLGFSPLIFTHLLTSSTIHVVLHFFLPIAVIVHLPLQISFYSLAFIQHFVCDSLQNTLLLLSFIAAVVISPLAALVTVSLYPSSAFSWGLLISPHTLRAVHLPWSLYFKSL